MKRQRETRDFDNRAALLAHTYWLILLLAAFLLFAALALAAKQLQWPQQSGAWKPCTCVCQSEAWEVAGLS